MLDELVTGDSSNGIQQIVVRDVIEGSLDIGIQYPFLALVRAS